MPLNPAVQLERQHLRNEVESDRVPNGHFRVSSGYQRLEILLDQADIVHAVKEEIDFERGAADLTIIEPDQGTGRFGCDGDGSTNAADRPEQDENQQYVCGTSDHEEIVAAELMIRELFASLAESFWITG